MVSAERLRQIKERIDQEADSLYQKKVKVLVRVF